MLDKLRTLLIPVIFCFLTIVAFEYYLQYQKKSLLASEKMDEGFLLHDKQLGWKLKPNWSGKHLHNDFDVNYQINHQGFRKSIQPSGNERKIAVLGDSFAFGIGVNNNDTFISQYNSTAIKNQTNQALVNYGIPGYSTDQELLLLKQLIKTNAIKDVLLIIYLGNDLIDNQHPYPIQAEYAKPYFEVSHNILTLKNSPVPLRQKTTLYKDKSLASEVLGVQQQSAILTMLSKYELGQRISGLFAKKSSDIENKITTKAHKSLTLLYAIINEMNLTVATNGGELTVALLPSQAYVVKQSSIPAIYQSSIQTKIKTKYNNTNIKVIDLANTLRSNFETKQISLFHLNEGHLNAKGHQVVADTLITSLEQQPFINSQSTSATLSQHTLTTR